MRLRFWLAVLGGVFLILLIGSAFLLKYDSATLVDFDEVGWQSQLTWAHPLGTDMLGRDTLARILIGARYSISYAVLSTAIAALIGWPLGLLFRRTPGWLQVVPVCLAYFCFIDPKNLLAPRWPSRIILVMISMGAFFPLRIVWTAVIVQIGMAPSALSNAVLLGILLASAFIYATLGGPSSVRTDADKAPRGNYALAASLFSFAVYAQAGIDAIGLGVQPPIPSWGALLASGFTEISVLPTVAVALTMILTAISVLAVADEISARLSHRALKHSL